jgi:hypothetical protein
MWAMEVTKKPQKLYLIWSRELDRYKIGISVDPESRLKELQTSSPSILEMIAFKNVKDARNAEAALHKKYASANVTGEWFELSDQDVVDLVRQWDIDLGVHWKKRNAEKIEVGTVALYSPDGKSFCLACVKEFSVNDNRAVVEIYDNYMYPYAARGSTVNLFADEVRTNIVDALRNKMTI